VDKRDRATRFRDRLRNAMEVGATSQSALARAVGVDRSTISQLLAGTTTRLPNAQVVAECAQALGVSADWLLGLTERPERPGDLLTGSLTITAAARSSADEQIAAWHEAAAGYKIRHVPATLPDMLKTAGTLRWEYGPHVGRTADQAIGAAVDRLDWFDRHGSDYEFAVPVHEIESMARGEGYYRGLPTAARIAQLDHITMLHDTYFPRLRLFLYDARRVFSAPVTIYGPLLAVIYLGQQYLAFRESGRVRTFAEHFDGLVREAEIDARRIPDFLGALKDEIAGRSVA
jgi:transcriptional regulator with XRE-family HTH domain